MEEPHYIRYILDPPKGISPVLNETCGRNAWTYGPVTETATVLAGSEVGFRVAYNTSNSPDGIFHPGVGQAFLSPVPEGYDLENYADHEEGNK